MIIKFISVICANYFFSLIFNVTKRNLHVCAVLGALGWAMNSMIIHSGNSSIIAAFTGGLLVTTLSYPLAKNRKDPVTMFLVPGIFPLVPGYILYRSIYFFTLQDYITFRELSFEAIGIALGIAISIIVGSDIQRIYKNIAKTQ